MKIKILILSLLALLGFSATAQETKKEKQWSNYLTASYSIGNIQNGTYADNTWFGIEKGITKKNLTLWVAAGRGSINNMGTKHDNIGNYWGEVGASISQKIGNVNTFALVGVGSYFMQNKVFIEYGAGFTYPISDKFDLGAKVTNWDGSWYVSPMITLNF